MQIFQPFAGSRGKYFQIEPRTERVARSGEHADTGIGVLFEVHERPVERLGRRGVYGVALIGTVQ